MPQNFWLTIAIEEASVVAQGVIAVQGASLTAAQKTALDNLVAAAQAVAMVF